MSTFWNTILGTELAKTLIRELPKIAEPKEQYTMTIENQKVQAYVIEEIEKGNRYVSHITNQYTGRTTVIMEKK